MLIERMKTLIVGWERWAGNHRRSLVAAGAPVFLATRDEDRRVGSGRPVCA